MQSLRDRLQNWANYMRSHQRRMVCGSAEGAWKSPQIWHPEGPRNDPDVQDALTIERAITMLYGRSPRSAEALKSHYLYRSRPEVVIRRLRLDSMAAYHEALSSAHDMLQAILDAGIMAIPLTARYRPAGAIYA